MSSSTKEGVDGNGMRFDNKSASMRPGFFFTLPSYRPIFLSCMI